MRNTPKRKPALLKLLGLFAALAMVAAACGADDAVGDAVGEATDAVEEAVDGDDGEEEEAMEDEEEEAMEDDEEEAMEDDEVEEAAAPGEFDGQTITVAVVNNGATDSIQRFTPDYFTAETGLNVEFLNLPEQELRERVTLAAGTGSAEFDAFMISPFEAPQFGGVNGWIQDLPPLAEADADYNVDDLLDPIRGALSLNGELYGVPFYGESSFVMFNQEIMDAAGIDFPAQPTWEEIAEIAEAVDTDDVAGICLRGLAGWGDLGASLTTVVNTFGGTWWEANDDGTPGEAQINQPDSGFRAATEFYVDLVQNFGEDDAANSSFPQCLELMQSGGAAMWYDATVAAGFLENEGLTGNLGVALAPTGPADLPAGWLGPGRSRSQRTLRTPLLLGSSSHGQPLRNTSTLLARTTDGQLPLLDLAFRPTRTLTTSQPPKASAT